jgi:hypothetical protein
MTTMFESPWLRSHSMTAFGRFLPLAKGSTRPVPDLEIVPQICKNGLCSGGINVSWAGGCLCGMSVQQIQFTTAINLR